MNIYLFSVYLYVIAITIMIAKKLRCFIVVINEKMNLQLKILTR